MKKNLNLRSLAAQAVEQVVEQGQSLSNVLPPLQQKSAKRQSAAAGAVLWRPAYPQPAGLAD
jgi:hypothetical protein